MKRQPRAFLGKANNEWLDDFVYISRQPLIDRGYKIISYDERNLENTLLNKDIRPNQDVIVGSVEATLAWFKLCNITPPKPISYPEQLKKYLRRNTVETVFGELGSDFPYFVKPMGKTKLFTGDIVEKEEHLDWIADAAIKDKSMNLTIKKKHMYCEPVYKSKVVDFVSEFRCFITNGEIRGIQFYKGDCTIFPSRIEIEAMVLDYTDCPSAYALDVGVMNGSGYTALVEVNDMWAIGSYGFNGKDYALMCSRRMKEIYNKNNK